MNEEEVRSKVGWKKSAQLCRIAGQRRFPFSNTSVFPQTLNTNKNKLKSLFAKSAEYRQLSVMKFAATFNF
ncbi:hypothetical protein L1887_18803 [Cichorium endivia]|nr:hypothetical protein L1887_18803 [Cichorium endivia]